MHKTTQLLKEVEITLLQAELRINSLIPDFNDVTDLFIYKQPN